MLALISPAKRLDEAPLARPIPLTQPALLEDATALAAVCAGLTPPELEELMGVSEKIAQLNFERFQAFSPPLHAGNAKPAVLTFAGDTYAGLQAPGWDAADFGFAQDHLGILSGLYGLLRPLDLIQPYRLEMGTRLRTARGKDLYAWWGARVTALVNERTAGHADRRVINLASQEYIKVVDPAALAGGGVSVVFKEASGKVVGLFAKRARGAMARYLVRNRLERAEQLQAFDEDGYAFRPERSSEVEWVYSR
ncbi:MAG: peroxide stress protein YaaA [Planctomycetota bacterium]